MPFSFQNLYIDQINELHSGEEQLSHILPNIIEVSSSYELREQIDHYGQEIRNHLCRLENCFNEVQVLPSGDRCAPVEGMIEEIKGVIHRGGNSAVKDAALIAMLQRVIHFKIAVYGAARTFSRHLNYRSMDLLQRALNEEADTDRFLTKLAEGGIFSTGINEIACRAKAYA